jgi:hypothetical protein
MASAAQGFAEPSDDGRLAGAACGDVTYADDRAWQRADAGAAVKPAVPCVHSGRVDVFCQTGKCTKQARAGDVALAAHHADYEFVDSSVQGQRY